MKTSTVITLPVAEPEYELFNEQVMRRTIEQSLADLREDIVANRDGEYSTASLARKRETFLLMGA